jgi:hypothetical protein
MTSIEGEVFFYHCFPHSCAKVKPATASRIVAYSAEVEAAVGVKTLELILEFGLLLHNEQLGIDVHNNAGRIETASDSTTTRSAPCNEPETVVLEQRRACFTCATLDDLRRTRLIGRIPVTHFDCFGGFAIGIDPEKGRNAGFLPVHYFYRSDTATSIRSLGGLSSLLTLYLLQIREVLTFIAYSERERKRRAGNELSGDLTSIENGYEQSGLVPRLAKPLYRDRILDSIRSASNEQLAYVESLLKFDRYHIGLIADSINMLLANYQTVDSRSFDEKFLYYFQQEWRAISAFCSDALLFEMSWRNHEDAVVQELVDDLRAEIDRLACTYGLQVDVNDALLLHGYKNPLRRFREMIAVVVCPSSMKHQVVRLLRWYRLYHVPIIGI